MLKRIIAMRPPLSAPILPVGWRETSSPLPFTRAYQNGWGMKVIVSIDSIEDGSEYLHCSVSRRKQLPGWDDLREVKNIFIGREEEAFQFLPKESEYINLHDYCLHIWHKL
jgi:hypothetical protein